MNVLRIIFIATLPGNENLFKGSMVFYILAAVILVIAAVSYTILMKNIYYMHYKKLSLKKSRNQI